MGAVGRFPVWALVAACAIGAAAMGAVGRFSVWALVAACAIGAAVIVLLLAGGTTATPGVSPSAPIAVQASFDPPAVEFGDRVTARVDVLLDRDAVRPGTLKVANDLGRLSQVGAARTNRTNRGRLSVVSFSVPAACVTDPCVAHAGATSLALPRVTAQVTASDGRVLRARTAWPSLRIGSRVTAADLAPVRPPFQVDESPPPPSYRIAPATLARLLEILAAVLAAAGVGLAVYEAVGLIRRRRHAQAPVGELELALRFAREAEARPAPDRRRALGLVARLLEPRDRPLAGEARELAWSEPKPEPRAVSDLVTRIERRVEV